MRWSRVLGSGLLLFVGVRWCAGGDGGSRPLCAEPPQLAVRATGFLALAGDAGARRVVELDRAGTIEREIRVDVPAESRVVGTPAGTAVVWRAGHQITVARIADDGSFRNPHRFGTRVRRLCDGIASTDQRWGVSFLEGDGTVWIVHGPTSTSRRGLGDDGDLAANALLEPAAAPVWCGVTSAGDQIVLVWRENAERVRMNFCSAKRCSPLAPQLPPELARANPFAVGCYRNACAFATRGADGVTHLTTISNRGQQLWRTALADAHRESQVTLIGAGDRQLAIAYIGKDGHLTVARVDAAGAAARLWRADDEHREYAALTWSRDRLLIARAQGPGLEIDVVALPR